MPIDEMGLAQIPGIPDARYYSDIPPSNLEQLIREIQEQRRLSGTIDTGVFLAISGGGDDGAFAAGVLNAWTTTGTRPEFMSVTGVSTGALTAPFAFLGPDYDDELQRMYGGFSDDQIYLLRDWLSILPEASVADSAPLAALIAEIADAKLLEAIATEHRRGRRLFVQSAELDSQRPVLWDLGAIAASGAPNALDVFHQALLASASMPGVFPPVLIEVETASGRYDELHVDGGVISGTVVLAPWQSAIVNVLSASGEDSNLRFYLLRNGKISPEPQTTDYDLIAIAGRSMSTMIKAQGLANIETAQQAARLRGAEFYVAWIGDDFEHAYLRPFDPEYMAALYDHGYEMMEAGDAWQSKVPYTVIGLD